MKMKNTKNYCVVPGDPFSIPANAQTKTGAENKT
jgi:hypothetical protein